MITYMNQSRIGQFDRCQEQFRRRWLEGEVIPPGVAARIGTGVHKGAEVNHREKMITGEDEPLSVIQDAARDGYIHSIRDGGVFVPVEELPSARSQISNGLDMSVKLAKLYRESLAPLIKPAMVESEIYLAHPDLPIPFRGTIDVFTSDGWLPDLKTAEKKWPAGRAAHEVQATLYWALIKEKTGKAPKRISFEVLTKSKLEHQSNETSRTQEDFDLLVQKTRMILSTIESGIFLPAPPGSWLCSNRFCGYWWTCKFIGASKKILPKRTV